MIKKKGYLCTVCGGSWECYVFEEFIMPFAICIYCYIDLDNIFNKHKKSQQACTLCDEQKHCASIPLLNNAVMTSINLCVDCHRKIKTIVEKS